MKNVIFGLDLESTINIHSISDSHHYISTGNNVFLILSNSQEDITHADEVYKEYKAYIQQLKRDDTDKYHNWLLTGKPSFLVVITEYLDYGISEAELKNHFGLHVWIESDIDKVRKTLQFTVSDVMEAA